MTEPSTEAFNDFLAAYLPKQVEILWEDVFSPEELAPMPPMDGPWACWPGTDIKLCSRPVKFKTKEALRKFFLSGKDHTGQYDVCVMRWKLLWEFPSPAQVALGADPKKTIGYLAIFAMIMKRRIQELTMQVGLA